MSILIAGATACASQQTTARTGGLGLSDRLIGAWSGTLEYKDYQDETRRVTLPTELTIERTAGESEALLFSYVYDDGPGKTVTSTETFVYRDSSNTLRWGDAMFQVHSVNEQHLIAQTEGSDNDRPATLQESITLDGDTLTIEKQVRDASSAEFTFRHRYLLQRSDRLDRRGGSDRDD